MGDGDGVTGYRAALYMSFRATPRKLPSHSVVVIHDLSVIELPEYSNCRQEYELELIDVCEKAGHLIVCNPWVKERLIELYNIDSEKISVIFNPIPSIVPRTQVNELPSEPFMLHACAGNPHKNLALLFKVWGCLGERAPKLVILGKSHLSHPLIDELGIRDKLIFLDRLDKDQLNFALSKAMALLLPSTLEGFATLVSEAAIQNTPSIIATNNGLDGVYSENEVIRAEALDTESWANAILDFLTNGDGGRVTRLRDRILRELNPEYILDKYLDILQSVSVPIIR